MANFSIETALEQLKDFDEENFDFLIDAKNFFEGKESVFKYPSYNNIKADILSRYSGKLLSPAVEPTYSRPNGDPGDPGEPAEYDIPYEFFWEWNDTFKRLFNELNKDSNHKDLMTCVNDNDLASNIWFENYTDDYLFGPDDDDVYSFFDIEGE